MEETPKTAAPSPPPATLTPNGHGPVEPGPEPEPAPTAEAPPGPPPATPDLLSATPEKPLASQDQPPASSDQPLDSPEMTPASLDELPNSPPPAPPADEPPASPEKPPASSETPPASPPAPPPASPPAPQPASPPPSTSAPPQTPPAPPTPPPAPPAGKKHPRLWWGGGQGGGSRSPRGSRSQSREGSPTVDRLAKHRSPTKSIADLVISALVNAAAGKSAHADKHDPTPPPRPAPPAVARRTPDAEVVPNITFTFFDAKDKLKAAERTTNGEDVEVVDEVTPDEEWEEDVEREKEVTETVVASPQRISVALTSDGDDDFVDARGTSSDSGADSPTPSPSPKEHAAPPRHEEPEYVTVEGRAEKATPDRDSTPTTTMNPIYRSASYSNAVEEGLYSCPRPQGAPPPPPAGPPPAPPSTAPPPVPEPDWTSTDESSAHMTSEYATFYVSPSGEPTSLDGVAAGRGGDYEELEYCSLRASQRGRRPRSTPNGTSGSPAPNGAPAGPSAAPRPALRLRRVRSRLGRAWKSVRGWWDEERSRIEDTFMRHVHAQAVGAFDKPSPAATQSCDNLDDDGDDFDDEEEEATAAAANVGTAAPAEGKDADDGGGAPPPGMFKRAISAPTIPRVLVLRRRKDSDETSSASTSIGNWGRASLARPGSALRRSKYLPEGQNGFEELRRYIKHGGDFCKDLTSILHERAEAEQVYAKSLAKLSSKLLKASKEAVGTVGQAWQRIGTEMECQGEIHRTFATALSEEVVKPLKQLVDSQHRIRKSVESSVDKTAKSLSEWRQAEAKSKKSSFMCARDNEKLQDAMVEGRQSSRGSSLHLHHAVHNKMSDKDVAKLETKRKKAEDSMKKADVEYYTFCIRAERARLEWETAVIRGSYCLQAIEEERLQNLKELASMYLRHVKEMGPKMVQSSDRLHEPVQMCDVASDIQTVVSLKGTGQPPSEQLLPDFYAEHVTLGMNRDRRKQALAKVLQLIKQDLERERRSKQGVENLARALQQTPNFGAEDSQQNVTEKLHHMRAMLTYLEAARYKVQNVLGELEGRANQTHPLSQHIIVHRDRQGLQQSILKVPPWVRKDSLDQINGDSPDCMDRGAADGNSVQPDSDFDEFSSQGSEKDFNSSLIISDCASTTQTSANPSVGTCRALYQYAANLYDELNLNPGDVINIHDKQDDGWWLGELNGTVGIFPATYVEEIK